MQRNNEQISEFKEKLVAVNRVSKTVKGGRNMRFSALMVVGDEKGRVGCGMGKAAEIPEAIRKGLDDAKKDMHHRPDRRHHHSPRGDRRVRHRQGQAHSRLPKVPASSPAVPVRAVLEAAGIKDIVTKSIGSNNKINMVKATLEGLEPASQRRGGRRACAARPWKRLLG